MPYCAGRTVAQVHQGDACLYKRILLLCSAARLHEGMKHILWYVH